MIPTVGSNRVKMEESRSCGALALVSEHLGQQVLHLVCPRPASQQSPHLGYLEGELERSLERRLCDDFTFLNSAHWKPTPWELK